MMKLYCKFETLFAKNELQKPNSDLTQTTHAHSEGDLNSSFHVLVVFRKEIPDHVLPSKTNSAKTTIVIETITNQINFQIKVFRS